tara:strand:+ start:73 stop:456 length:384 start_codon:yes stop_codon:yes gene_type:complete
MNYLKNARSNIWAFALKHTNVVVTVLICLCFFFFYKISSDTKHYEKLHNLQMENVMICNELGQSMDMLTEQARHADKLEEALEIRTDQRNEAAAFVNFLIERLKALGEWPPKENPSPKPSNPTRSEA